MFPKAGKIKENGLPCLYKLQGHSPKEDVLATTKQSWNISAREPKLGGPEITETIEPNDFF